jgi:hypothetical protein
MTLAAALLLALAACGERPQRIISEDTSVAAQAAPHDVRERTLRQGESRRMAY